jgi:hypothetical protein
MSGVLDFQAYLGGPDQIQVEQIFPSNQRTLIYNFNQDITGWTFTTDYQTIVVDEVQFNRSTGKPNFSKSTVIGTFPKVEVTGEFVPEVIDQTKGTVKIHFPANMYTGAIIPDARQNVPITVFSVTWTDDATPIQRATHRWGLIQSWEPDVIAGDPILEDDYVPLVLGA